MEKIGYLLTMQMGSGYVLLNGIRFRRGFDVTELKANIDRLEKKSRRKEPTVRHIFIKVDL